MIDGIFSGNMDFIVAYPLSENAYNKMKWKSFEKYRIAKREPFYVNGTLSGYALLLNLYVVLTHVILHNSFVERYVKKADNFIDAVILNAGHMVPTDQPLAALELIDRFIKETL